MKPTEDLGERILQLKKTLEKRERERAELQGELRSVMSQLQEMGIDNLDTARKQLEENRKTIEKVRESIQEKIAEVEELMFNE